MYLHIGKFTNQFISGVRHCMQLLKSYVGACALKPHGTESVCKNKVQRKKLYGLTEVGCFFELQGAFQNTSLWAFLLLKFKEI
ncbi:hypothetical protein scyTo_0009777 [Scyliorhinus torazame]|uniref:Uncharacterized protein n=1 Tax=Scyliorhinus torazame TaxID=75743 RepID=A0A401NTG5_SCYTO|nr:hypothetical protein [Scyliorhinus torazame]